MDRAPATRHAPRHVLVTGGAGFIGANLVHHLLSTDSAVRVWNLDKLTYAASLDALEGLSDPTRHVLVQGDVADGELVGRLLETHDIDTVIHLAAESHVDRSIAGPEAFLHSNIEGTFRMLEAARRVWGPSASKAGRWSSVGGRPVRFHHVSTDEVYGSLGPTDPPFHEGTPYAPRSPYSSSKAASDHLVHAWHHTYGLPVTITHCSNNYGPFQHAEKFLPTVVRSCAERRPIPVYGQGTNVRDWLFVRDHCEAIDRVVRHAPDGSVYGVGGGNEWSNLDLAHQVCRIMDRLLPGGAPHASLISFVTDRPGHDFRYAIDTSRIETELGWRRTGTFDAHLETTVRWLLDRHQRRAA